LNSSKYISKNLSKRIYKAEISDYEKNCQSVEFPDNMIKNDLLSEFRGLLSETGSPSTDISKSDFDFDYKGIVPNQEFISEDVTLQSIFSPGHAIDHMCFYFKEENSLFTGDNILGGSSSVVEDLSIYLESLKKMKNFPGVDETTILYPAHGKIEDFTTFDKYLNHRYQRIDQCRKFLLENKNKILTPRDFVDAIYVPAGLDKKLYLPACGNVLSCLIKMTIDGEISRVTDEKEGGGTMSFRLF